MKKDLLILLIVIIVITVIAVWFLGRPSDSSIDIVYSWIDGDNPHVKEQIEYWRSIENPIGEAGTSNRFNTMDELRYSLRSVHEFAPWVRNVYVITSFNIIPDWFDVKVGEDHGVFFIDDSELLDVFPVFNSLAKEAVKHRIPGLSERYLYFNDDLFFGSEVFPEDFMNENQQAYAFFEPTNFVSADPLEFSENDYFAQGLLFTRNKLLSVFPKISDPDVQVLFEKMQLKKHTPDIHFTSEDYLKWETIPDDMQRTANGRFRDVDQIYDNTLFDNYWKLAQGKAVPGDISYAYLYIRGNLEVEAGVYEHIERESPKVFCINDGIKDENEETAQSIEMFSDFLKAYFPDPAPWEIL